MSENVVLDVEKMEDELKKLYNLEDSVERREYYHDLMTRLVRMKEFRDIIYMYIKELKNGESVLNYDISYKLDEFTVSIEIEIEILKSYMEIEELCSNEDEEMYDECIERVVEDINTECIRYVDIDIVDHENLVKIEDEKIECNRNYCRCGNRFIVTISDYSVSKLIRKTLSIMKDIVNVIKHLYYM